MTSRLAHHLSVIPLWMLAGVTVVLVAGFFLVPRSRRLEVTIVVAFPWLMAGQFLSLGVLSSVAKATVVLAYGLIALAAALHPGPRRRIPLVVWGHILLAVLSFLFVITVRDLSHALALRIQWLALTVSAVLVIRASANRQQLDRVFAAITVGASLSVGVTVLSLAVEGSSAIDSFGRLRPFGASPNQLGIAVALALPFTAHRYLHARGRRERLIVGGVIAAAGVLVLMTASRSSVIIALGTTLAVLSVRMRRRTSVAVLLVAAGFAAFYATRQGDISLSRLSNLRGARTEILSKYVEHSVSQRPFLGLLQSSNKRILLDDTIGAHPHNAYIHLLYMGGLLLFIPEVFLVFYTLVCLWRLRRSGSRWHARPRYARLIAVLMLAVYAHGFVNGAIFYPNGVWPWLHIFLSSWILTDYAEVTFVAKAARRASPVAAAAPPRRIPSGMPG